MGASFDRPPPFTCHRLSPATPLDLPPPEVADALRHQHCQHDGCGDFRWCRTGQDLGASGSDRPASRHDDAAGDRLVLPRQRWCDDHRTRRRAESAAAGTPRTWIGGTITDIDRVQSDVRLAAGSTEVKAPQDSTSPPGPLSGRTGRTAAVAVLVCGNLLAAGVWQRNDHSSSIPAATAGPDHSVPDVHALLAAWDSALSGVSGRPLVITSALQDQIGDWSLSEGDNNKRALMDGQVLAGDDIAAAPPAGNSHVRWQDGRTKGRPGADRRSGPPVAGRAEPGQGRKAATGAGRLSWEVRA